MNYDVTVLIRAKNEMTLIGRCIDAILNQKAPYSTEILIIDSGSTDGTLDVCRSRPVRLVEIAPSEFNYGRTLNQGVQMAAGRFVVPLSAHAIPVNDRWLERLVEPMTRRDDVVATCSRQIPWPEAHPFEKLSLATLFGTESCVLDPADPPSDPFQVVFSNASACYRKDVVARWPFAELPWAEDRFWAWHALQRGQTLGYAADSMVYHSHALSPGAVFRTAKLTGRAKSSVHGAVTFGGFARSILNRRWLRSALRTGYRGLKEFGPWGPPGLRMGLSLMACSAASQLGQRVGRWTPPSARSRED